MAKAQRRRAGSTAGPQNTSGRGSLVRSSWNRKERIQIKVAIPGLVMRKESNKKIVVGLRLGRENARETPSKRRRDAQFAVCIDNEGYQASLELGKLYRILPDKDAQAHGLVRVIDESGEDYAYSSHRFHSMKVPSVIERALWHTRR